MGVDGLVVSIHSAVLKGGWDQRVFAWIVHCMYTYRHVIDGYHIMARIKTVRWQRRKESWGRNDLVMNPRRLTNQANSVAMNIRLIDTTGSIREWSVSCDGESRPWDIDFCENYAMQCRQYHSKFTHIFRWEGKRSREGWHTMNFPLTDRLLYISEGDWLRGTFLRLSLDHLENMAVIEERG